MKINLPKEVNCIIKILKDNGHEAYAVGGCVRDSILGKNPADWDITTSAKPEEIKSIFHKTIDTGIEHGTVTVRMNHKSFEVTTYRIDGEYLDARHPKDVEFTSDLSEDLLRHDFTINAMAYNDEDGLVDIFGGIDDIEKKVIRCVGDAKQRFTEDALRMMRAVRFSGQLGFTIEENTYRAIEDLAPNISKISVERIQVELVKLLCSDNPGQVKELYKTGLSAHFMSELDDMFETPQHTKWHRFNVGDHTVCALENIANDRILRLAMFFHDIGKPVAHFSTDGVDHFFGHGEIGGRMTKDIMRRLKFDNDTIRLVSQLVTYHDERPRLTEVKIRRAIVKIGIDAFPNIFAIKRADTIAQSDYMYDEKMAEIQKFEDLYKQILEKGQCISKSTMAINGKDLMDLGLKQGPKIGQILDQLFEEVLSFPERNNREYLIMKAKQLI